MTKERKIEILKDLLIQLSDSANILCTCEADERCDVIEEYIKALEQQPSDDCVSRQAVLDKAELVELEDGQTFYCISPEDVKALPLVIPTRKIGKWIKVGDRGFGYSDTVICKCSECEYKTEFTGKFSEGKLIVDMERAYKFCPNCGTEMRGDENENIN